MFAKDQFKKDCEKAENFIESIKKLQYERQQLITIKQSTVRVDSKIRGEMQTLAVEIDHLFNSLKLAPNLSVEETKKRENYIKELENQYLSFEQAQKTQKTQKQQFQTQDTSQLSNQQVREYQKQMYKQQDETLDGIQGTVENLGNIGKGIGEEVDIHNRLLEDADNKVEATTNQISGLNMKAQKLMRIMPNSCYIITIFILIITLALILIFL